jgi:hypothetical protein
MMASLSACAPQQNNTPVASIPSVPGPRMMIRPVRSLAPVTIQPRRSSPPELRNSAASRAHTARKSTIPVPGEWSAASPVASGSIWRISSGERRLTPATPLARARRSISSNRGSSCGPVATISLPTLRVSIPFSWQ